MENYEGNQGVPMPQLAMDDVLRFLRHTCGHDGGDKTDAELLESCLAHEEVAFSMLLQRYGPMVLGICRRLSADSHAAEDGFQATFWVARSEGTPEGRARPCKSIFHLQLS